MMRWFGVLLMGWLALITVAYAAPDPFARPNLLAAASNPKAATVFLPVDQAFAVESRQEGDQLVLSFRVTKGHYLYKERFRFRPMAGLTVGEPVFNRQPTFEDDPEFGRVAVYDQDVVLRMPVDGQGELTLRWQGCAKAGLCYPPQDQKILILPTAVQGASRAAVQSDGRTRLERSAGVQSIRIPLPIPTATIDQLISPAASVDVPLPLTEQSAKQAILPTDLQKKSAAIAITPSNMEEPLAIANTRVADEANQWPSVVAGVSPAVITTDLDPFGLAANPWAAMGLLFLAGLLLAFTPCVLPMLPIVANVVARQHRKSARHGLLLSGAYAIGVASSYAVLGAVVALFGHQVNLVGWLQQPEVLLSFAALFVLLALNTFELLPLRLPRFVSERIDRLGQIGHRQSWAGGVLGSGLAGFFSALVVSPCVSAPLAGVLLSVSTVGDPLLGAAALFMLGLGLSAPLMLLGATEGRLLPQAGAWLHWIRQGFGLLLLGVAAVLVGRVFDSALMLVIWALLLMLLALWMWQWHGRGQWVSRAFAIVLGVWSVLQLCGAALDHRDPWRPLQGMVQASAVPVSADAVPMGTVPVITQLSQLQQMQSKYPRLLVDVTADWCISCKIMERELFGATPVAGLTQWQRVKLDVTETNADSQQVLAKLQLFGPPALLFYQQGQLVVRMVGEVSAEDLAQQLQQLNR